MPFSPERAYYRINYPERERPEVLLGESSLPVLECSERGLRLDVSAAPPLAAGDSIEGTVRFRRGDNVAVSGVVARADGTVVVVLLDPPGLPFSVLLKEQRFLLQHYPGRLTPSSVPPQA